jgi:hypothetical protein
VHRQVHRSDAHVGVPFFFHLVPGSACRPHHHQHHVVYRSSCSPQLPRDEPTISNTGFGDAIYASARRRPYLGVEPAATRQRPGARATSRLRCVEANPTESGQGWRKLEQTFYYVVQSIWPW